MRKSNPQTRFSLCELAQTAMMLEVCCKEKPGNVDRCHDYDDTALEHFLSSVILAHDALTNAENFDCLDDCFDNCSDNSVNQTYSENYQRKAVNAVNAVNLRPEYPDEYRDDFLSAGLGRLIYDAVLDTNQHSGGNTHFGAFILIIPLIAGHGIEGAKKLIHQTNVSDAVAFYLAFGLTSVRMNESDDMDVNSPSAIDDLREKGMTLYDVMEYSSANDMIAAEWVNGFSLTGKFADALIESGRGKDAIPEVFLKFMSEHIDTFVVKKLGIDIGRWTKETARDVLDGKMTSEEFDRICLSKGVNPGSLADITIAGIFIALLEGWDWDI